MTKINFNIFLNSTPFLFKESFLPFTINQQKKIVFIASILLGCLAALYYKFHHYYRSSVSNPNETCWLKITKSQRLIDFKKNWRNLIGNGSACKEEAQKLQAVYKKSKMYIEQQWNKLSPYNAPLGVVYSIPNNFGTWMPGIAFIASYLAEKKDIKGLYVCKSLEAFATQLKQIALSDSDQRCACIVGGFSSGFSRQYPGAFEPNFPQHKVTVCIEKKNGQLTIALLESQPEPGSNDKINPSHLTDNIWQGYKKWNQFNNEELIFRAILKACRHTKCSSRLLVSNVLRQRSYGCAAFALSDAVSFLQNPDFFNQITCSSEKAQIDSQYQIEKITQLPPEFMIGSQSYQLLQEYRSKNDQALFDQPLPGRKKTLQDYLNANQVTVNTARGKRSQNYYAIRKSFKYLNFFIESLNTLKSEEIKQITQRTLLTHVDSDLFPELSKQKNMEVRGKYHAVNLKDSQLESCQLPEIGPFKLIA